MSDWAWGAVISFQVVCLIGVIYFNIKANRLWKEAELEWKVAEANWRKAEASWCEVERLSRTDLR